MVFLDNDGFLNALVSTLEKHKEKGSVTITFKRSKYLHQIIRKGMLSIFIFKTRGAGISP